MHKRKLLGTALTALLLGWSIANAASAATTEKTLRVGIMSGEDGAIVESGVRGVGKRQEKAVAIEGECCFSR
ncbi:hypothetical protein [Paraburkholderia kururiensis]|uniref:hypothetical protein n=1 Tax=Paraburkholderia kururiensis TaxID=984307 RepID=UPI0015926E44|nr:hypothetical protein [Paraburkholderia kururiensis]